MKQLFILLLALAVFAACGDSSRKRSSSTDFYPTPPPTPSEANVMCPMCNGTGVFEYMPGDAMAPRVKCPGCQGSGSVTPEQVQQIMQAQQQANGAMGGNGNPGYSPSSSHGKSVEQLQLELRKANELLEGLIRDRDMCTSVTLLPQYERMIMEQQEYIAKLEAELRAAGY